MGLQNKNTLFMVSLDFKIPFAWNFKSVTIILQCTLQLLHTMISENFFVLKIFVTLVKTSDQHRISFIHTRTKMPS